MASSEKEAMKARMVLAVPSIRKSHVGGRSRRKAHFSLRKQPVSPDLHRGCTRVGYDFAEGNEDELVSYTTQKPRHAAVRYFTHSNHLYSIAATTNVAGAVIERYSYNAYGLRIVKNSAGTTLAKSVVGQDRGFTGYELDAESGLYFARARMYSAKLGRFVSRDPLVYINGMSVYSAYFVPNKKDPRGTVAEGESCSYEGEIGYGPPITTPLDTEFHAVGGGDGMGGSAFLGEVGGAFADAVEIPSVGLMQILVLRRVREKKFDVFVCSCKEKWKFQKCQIDTEKTTWHSAGIQVPTQVQLGSSPGFTGPDLAGFEEAADPTDYSKVSERSCE
jgi:RHS repeat-associated protein